MFSEFMAYAHVALSLAVAAVEHMLPELGESVQGFPAFNLAWATMAIGVASLLVAGVFQSFSDFVMRGLVLAEPMGGAQSMQMINRTVMRSVFIVLLLGLAPMMLSFGLLTYSVLEEGARFWVLAGTGVYIASVFFVTMLGNVPMNNRLDRMVPSEPSTARYWDHYGRVWTRWNHLRTIGSLVAGLCFLFAALELAGQ